MIISDIPCETYLKPTNAVATLLVLGSNLIVIRNNTVKLTKVSCALLFKFKFKMVKNRKNIKAIDSKKYLGRFKINPCLTVASPKIKLFLLKFLKKVFFFFYNLTSLIDLNASIIIFRVLLDLSNLSAPAFLNLDFVILSNINAIKKQANNKTITSGLLKKL